MNVGRLIEAYPFGVPVPETLVWHIYVEPLDGKMIDGFHRAWRIYSDIFVPRRGLWFWSWP